jgi:hypothetical protein
LSKFRTATVSSSHYAYHWKAPLGAELNDRHAVNELAIKYATLEDGPEKEEACLALLKSFHSYLSKYVSMITLGHLPQLKTPAGKEATKLLQMLIPEGQKLSKDNLSKACRSLHLAFKQNTTDDIYDTLVMCLMRAVRKYDPHYTHKVRKVCEAIDEHFPRKRGTAAVFNSPDVSNLVGLESLSYIRLLVRRGYLESVVGPKKKVVGYKRTKVWPPKQSFFESGPIGFVYYLPRYFRYYLHEHICSAMGQIEAAEGMLQLDHGRAIGGDFPDASGDYRDRRIPHAEGQFVGTNGSRWAADLGLVNHPLDVSSMTLEWVKSTSDRLFRNLSPQERHLLYLIYVKEMKWVEIAASLDTDVDATKRQFNQIMTYLKGHAQPRRVSG